MSYENRRLKRLLGNDSYKLCIVPMDHSLTLGPIDGLKDYISTVRELEAAKVDGVILHKGSFNQVVKNNLLLDTLGILHLSGSTLIGNHVNEKEVVSDVYDALKLGADAVSFHAYFGADCGNKVLRELGTVVSECKTYNMPVIAMVYVGEQQGNGDCQVCCQ